MKRIIKNFKSNFTLAILLAIISSAFNVAGGYELSVLLNAAASHSINELTRGAITIICIWGLFFAVNTFRKNDNFKLKTKINNHIRAISSEKIIYMSNNEWLKGDESGHLADYTESIKQIDDNVLDPLFDAFYSIFALIFSLIALILIHWSIGVLSIIIFLIIMYIPQLFQRRLQKKSEEVSRSSEQFTAGVNDQLSGRMEYVIHQKEKMFLSKINVLSSNYEKSRYNLEKSSNNVTGFIGFISMISQFFIVIAVALVTIVKGVQIGSILSVGNLAGTFMNSVSDMLSDYAKVKANEHLLKIDLTYSAENEKQLGFEDIHIVDLEKIDIDHTHSVAYKAITTDFHLGGKYLITGESGSGKSTLLKTLFLCDNKYTGSILFDQTERKNFSYKNIIKSVAYIDQGIHIFNDTLRNNMTFGNPADETELINIMHALKMDHLYERCNSDLDYQINENGKNISGGERQKIALARAILSHKNILVLDESLSAIDAQSAADITDYLIHNQRITLFMISHNMDERNRQEFDTVLEL